MKTCFVLHLNTACLWDEAVSSISENTNGSTFKNAYIIIYSRVNCSSTSAMVKILYISGKMTGATSGICVSVTSRVNSGNMTQTLTYIYKRKETKKNLLPIFCESKYREIANLHQKPNWWPTKWHVGFLCTVKPWKDKYLSNSIC